MNDAQILLSGLGVRQLTLFGFAMALTLCAERALCAMESERNGDSSSILSSSFQASDTSVTVSSYLAVVAYLSQSIEQVFVALDQEHVQKSAFNPLDEYRELSPQEQEEVMGLLEREKKVFYTIYQSYLPSTKHRFAQGSRSTGKSIPASHGGLSFSGIVEFARDFEMSPDLLNRSQLLEIFNHVLAAEREALQWAAQQEGAPILAVGSSQKGLKPAVPQAETLSFPQVNIVFQCCFVYLDYDIQTYLLLYIYSSWILF